MLADLDSPVFWDWKSRECRVAARLIKDPARRLALLELAQVYRGFSERARNSVDSGPGYGISLREEPAAAQIDATG